MTKCREKDDDFEKMKEEYAKKPKSEWDKEFEREKQRLKKLQGYYDGHYEPSNLSLEEIEKIIEIEKQKSEK